ncbi:M15 family metallopeptidase [Desemzia sp. RIT804]|uniref:M15 family metallopeptidase n=1 Tax=Desemzia sp. RIT 804 TaxID=2810209 RepID=UPI001951F5FF|nr:M15 family metallopeptidase [Desemzia sp. RIT 804]MBM6614382.1 M15 family metallopeptidase [Desemzia sp. RIT 804]
MKLRIMIPTVALLFLVGCQNEPTTSQNETNSSTNSEVSSSTVEESQASSESSLSPEEVKEQEMLAELPDVSTKDWNLILVNNWNPIDETLEIPLEEVADQKEIDARIMEPYESWMNAASQSGYNIFLASSYRSVDRQRANYNNSIQQYINEGYSEEEATKMTEDYIAIPGGSEHHTGLAVDMIDSEWLNSGKGLVPEYDTQESQHWLVDTAADYGFILRFPKNKEEATGIQYESWHFRYVGVENAQFIKKYDLALEEYIELLEKAGKTEDQ